MKILLMGNGGREHALAWKIMQSPRAAQLFVAPGNAGTRALNIDIRADDTQALLRFAKEQHVDLVVVGPEAPLANGVVDKFQREGISIFGPTQAATQLESSKAFSKKLMKLHNVPTAAFETFDDANAAIDFLHAKPFASEGCVVKADGLAAGKGVFVCDDLVEAESALRRILIEREFGESGSCVVVEERLSGSELSVLAFCDGKHVKLMPPARDHKRVGDGDVGPNTGGMGAFAPVPQISNQMLEKIRREAFQPIIDAMREQGEPYVGVLFAGLMLSDSASQNDFHVLEFNCRFGDPETQVILPLLESDLIEVMSACIDGKLDEIDLRWKPGVAATIVLASGGYPGAYKTGVPIFGLDDASPDILVFHAGTTLRDGAVVTNGGRVLNVASVGNDLGEALARAYDGASKIHFDGAHYRKDIGRLQEVVSA